MDDLVERLEAASGRFLKWAYKEDYSGPPVISIPRHPGNIDALLEEAAAEIRSLRAQVEQERAGIVAWLAASAAEDADTMRKLHAGKKLTPTMTAEWEALIAAKSGIAAAIDRHEDKEPRA